MTFRLFFLSKILFEFCVFLQERKSLHMSWICHKNKRAWDVFFSFAAHICVHTWNIYIRCFISMEHTESVLWMPVWLWANVKRGRKKRMRIKKNRGRQKVCVRKWDQAFFEDTRNWSLLRHTFFSLSRLFILYRYSIVYRCRKWPCLTDMNIVELRAGRSNMSIYMARISWNDVMVELAVSHAINDDAKDGGDANGIGGQRQKKKG